MFYASGKVAHWNNLLKGSKFGEVFYLFSLNLEGQIEGIKTELVEKTNILIRDCVMIYKRLDMWSLHQKAGKKECSVTKESWALSQNLFKT